MVKAREGETTEAITYTHYTQTILPPGLLAHLYLDNSGTDSRNLIGQLQVSKRSRNLERDSKCQRGGF